MSTTNKPKRYTIADIKAANKAGGWYFFDKPTLRHFKESGAAWGVRHRGPFVFIHHKQTEEVRQFNTETGAIGLPIKDFPALLKTLGVPG
jgi:hypothetical protein